MKTVRFEGYLKDMYPDGIQLEAASAAEAITGLQNFPGFRKSDGVLHQVTLPMFQSRDAIFSPTGMKEILLVPVEEGAGGKKGGIFQIIIGVVLVIAAAAVLIASGGSLAGPAMGMWLAGVSMILGGIMALLMPVPKAPSVASEEKSNYIPANKNTVKVGTPIPLLFGRRKVYGHFLSFDIDSKNKGETPIPVTPPAPTAPGPALSTQTGTNSTVNYIIKLTGI